MGYHTSGPDDYVASNMYTRADHCIAAKPYIVTDGHLFSIFVTRVAADGMNRVAGGVNRNIGSYLAVVTDPDPGHIQKGAVIVGKKVFSHLNVFAIVAVKGWIDECVL